MYITLDKCSFAYENKTVLNDISFELNKGEILAVVGRNGIGKTTLLKCLTGIYKWQSGSYLVAGNSNYDKNIIGYVSQARKMPFAYTVTDFVLFGRNAVNSYFASPSKDDYNACVEILDLLDISILKDRKCNELSGGELQMVFLAKALVSNPDILVLDEPESNLDFYNQLKLLNIVKHICKQRKTTVIINSHFINNVSKIADKFLLLNEGGYIFGNYDKVLTNYNIEKYFKVKNKTIDVEYNENIIKNIVFLENV